ncbi:MAG: hypothetical protein HFE66_01155 [Clostridiales bacterium]|nr:hypothetical protein [Clostridiales bacterium]
MNIDIFSAQLVQSLTARGIDGQTANTYVKDLLRTLTEEDLREISGYETKEDFVPLSESLASLIREKNARLSAQDTHTKVIRTGPVSPTDVETRQPIGTDNLQHTKTGMQPIRPTESTAVKNPPDNMEHTKIGVPVPGMEEGPLWEEEVGKRGFVPLTPRGKVFFWTLLLVTFPLSLCFSIMMLFIFVLCFLTVCALIGASFLMIGGEVVAGTACFLVGVIYGIIQICTTSVGIGIYEIGLGIICAGVFLALGVLTYYLAVRGLPYVLRQELLFTRHLLRQIKPMINRWREECNKR